MGAQMVSKLGITADAVDCSPRGALADGNYRPTLNRSHGRGHKHHQPNAVSDNSVTQYAACAGLAASDMA